MDNSQSKQLTVRSEAAVTVIAPIEKPVMLTKRYREAEKLLNDPAVTVYPVNGPKLARSRTQKVVSGTILALGGALVLDCFLLIGVLPGTGFLTLLPVVISFAALYQAVFRLADEREAKMKLLKAAWLAVSDNRNVFMANLGHRIDALNALAADPMLAKGSYRTTDRRPHLEDARAEIERLLEMLENGDDTLHWEQSCGTCYMPKISDLFEKLDAQLMQAGAKLETIPYPSLCYCVPRCPTCGAADCADDRHGAVVVNGLMMVRLRT